LGATSSSIVEHAREAPLLPSVLDAVRLPALRTRSFLFQSEQAKATGRAHSSAGGADPMHQSSLSAPTKDPCNENPDKRACADDYVRPCWCKLSPDIQDKHGKDRRCDWCADYQCPRASLQKHRWGCGWPNGAAHHSITWQQAPSQGSDRHRCSLARHAHKAAGGPWSRSCSLFVHYSSAMMYPHPCMQEIRPALRSPSCWRGWVPRQGRPRPEATYGVQFPAEPNSP